MASGEIIWAHSFGICLRQGRYRTPNNQAETPLDEWPSREDEPDDQGGDHQTLLLREPRPISTSPTSSQLTISSVSSKADAGGERYMIELMPEDLTDERRGELTRLFEAVRRFADEHHLAERRDRPLLPAPVPIPRGRMLPCSRQSPSSRP